MAALHLYLNERRVPAPHTPPCNQGVHMHGGPVDAYAGALVTRRHASYPCLEGSAVKRVRT
jgi:hypothetical protein